MAAMKICEVNYINLFIYKTTSIQCAVHKFCMVIHLYETSINIFFSENGKQQYSNQVTNFCFMIF